MNRIERGRKAVTAPSSADNGRSLTTNRAKPDLAYLILAKSEASVVYCACPDPPALCGEFQGREIISPAPVERDQRISDMKRRAIALALALSLLSLSAVGVNGCGKQNTLSSIIVTPADPIFVKGTSLQLIVKAYLSDGMIMQFWTQVTWQSSDTNIATVSSTGVVYGNDVGTAIITATDIAHPSITGSITVNVTKTPLVSIDVTPSNLVISMGTTTQVLYRATGTLADGTTMPNLGSSVNWTSSHLGVAVISNSVGFEGLAAAVAPGTTQIVATDPVTNVSGLTTLTITP